MQWYVFVIDLTYTDSEVFANHRSLPVYGHGSTQKEAVESFWESFNFQWENLVNVDVDTLTPGGLKRRDAMINAAIDAILLALAMQELKNFKK